MQCVEVYDVGREQLRRWVEQSEGMGVLCDFPCYTESACVGAYVVVSCYAWFGGMQVIPSVEDVCFTLGDAIESRQYMVMRSDVFDVRFNRVGVEYEIWHIVRDADLLPCEYVTCEDCGASMREDIATSYAVVSDRCDKTVYRCPDCAKRYNEDGYRYTYDSWRLKMFRKTVRPRCELCGDSHYGPWVVYNYAGRYMWICEPCETTMLHLKELLGFEGGARLA